MRHRPCSSELVTDVQNSGTFVLPSTRNPAPRERLHARRVRRRHVVGQDLAGVRRGEAGDVDHILDGDRHPAERAEALGGAGAHRIVDEAGLLASAPLVERHEGPQRRVQAVDAIEVRLEQLRGGDGAGADGLCLRHRHPARPSRSWCAVPGDPGRPRPRGAWMFRGCCHTAPVA